MTGTGHKGEKKALDAQINLVPFIDLMAVTISFLLYTAVWTQLGRLQVSQSGGATEEALPPNDVPPPLSLTVTQKELRLSAGPTAYPAIPVVRGAKHRLELEGLATQLKEVLAQTPEQKNVTLQVDDAVSYDDLVRVIDECIADGIPNVSIGTGMT